MTNPTRPSCPKCGKSVAHDHSRSANNLCIRCEANECSCLTFPNGKRQWCDSCLSKPGRPASCDCIHERNECCTVCNPGPYADKPEAAPSEPRSVCADIDASWEYPTGKPAQPSAYKHVPLTTGAQIAQPSSEFDMMEKDKARIDAKNKRKLVSQDSAQMRGERNPAPFIRDPLTTAATRGGQEGATVNPVLNTTNVSSSDEARQLKYWQDRSGQIYWRLAEARAVVMEMERDLLECEKKLAALEWARKNGGGTDAT